MLPADVPAEWITWRRPLLADCDWPTCQGVRGTACTTPAGFKAPYHGPRRAAVKNMDEATVRAEFVKLDAEQREARRARDAMIRRPLDAETLAARERVAAAWAQVCHEVR